MCLGFYFHRERNFIFQVILGHTADAGVGPDVFTGFNHIDDGVDGEDDSHDADGGADTAHERQGKEVAAHGYTGVSDGSKDRNEEPDNHGSKG